jgi:hypothetical protein
LWSLPPFCPGLWLSLTDTYGVETAPGKDDLLILISVLALDLAEDRERHERHERRDRH